MLRDLRLAGAFIEVAFPGREERFVSLASDRCLLVVAAAISVARVLLRPRRSSASLMCPYWRTRVALLTPRGAIFLLTLQCADVCRRDATALRSAEDTWMLVVFRSLKHLGAGRTGDRRHAGMLGTAFRTEVRTKNSERFVSSKRLPARTHQMYETRTQTVWAV